MFPGLPPAWQARDAGAPGPVIPGSRGGLIAPVRSGMLITRRDLADAATALRLPSRAGGRAFILRSLIDTDPAATFGWLAGRAAWWAARHQADDPPLGGVARHWHRRAQASYLALGQTSTAGT
jgi:hypothetical protein